MAAETPPFPVDAGVLSVLDALWSSGHGGYLVGGGVRDALLGLAVSDWDIATDARPETLLRIFPGSNYQNRFGTVLARGMEITTFRRDHRYADHRRPDTVTFSQDVFEDLARRDLTINAIAWGRRGPDAGTRLVDPADGQGDLDARLVRAVGDPNLRFDEDALRLLRAVRIAARLDFTIEATTRQAMVAHAGDIEWVSEERVGSEVRRMLAAETPSRAIGLMAETGILEAALPEVGALPPPALDHAMHTLDSATSAHPGQELLALAALFGESGAETARVALARLRVSGRDIEAVATLVDVAPLPYDPAWTDADVRRYMGCVPAEQLEPLLWLRAAQTEAAVPADPEGVAREAELAARVSRQRETDAPLTLGDLAVDGRDLRETLGIPEGPVIGTILERLLADVIDEPSLNARMTLLTRASLVLDELVQGGGRSGPSGAPIR